MQLPTHSPDLNPTESIWSMIKSSMVNFSARNLDRLERATKRHLKMIRYRPS